jgi:hypothetical protein
MPLVAPRKARGSVTHGKLRCNMSKRPGTLHCLWAKDLPERAVAVLDRRAFLSTPPADLQPCPIRLRAQALMPSPG